MRTTHRDLMAHDLTSAEATGVLLAVREWMAAQGEPWASVDEILTATSATGASATAAHALKDTLLQMATEDGGAWLAALATALAQDERGDKPDEARRAEIHRLSIEVLRFAMEHPGCVSYRGDHPWYSERFQRFVLELRHGHAGVPTAEFARSIDLPLGTLEDWLRGGRRSVGPTAHERLQCIPRKVRTHKA